MLPGVTLDEAEAEVDGTCCQNGEPVTPGQDAGVEVGLDERVVDDVQDAEG